MPTAGEAGSHRGSRSTDGEICQMGWMPQKHTAPPKSGVAIHGVVRPRSVHLIDGTYELFRQFYGRRRFEKGSPAPFGAVAGVLHSILEMIEGGVTHVGVATDHVIESFRNALWPGYKTGEGIEPALRAQFVPLEQALEAMGVAVWPMIELEADDALASAARIAAEDKSVERVCIWTPDKDLAQCVRGDRIVQVMRRAKTILDAAGVKSKFGVIPERIPDFLALVGDAADGYPGIEGIGRVGAASLIDRYGAIEDFPAGILGKNRERALLFKDLATLRRDVEVFGNVEALRWRGPTAAFAALAPALADGKLLGRCRSAAEALP
jgi:5'-3' exonuclease